IGERIAAITAQLQGADGPAAEQLRFVLTTLGHFASTSDRVVLPRVLLAEAGNFPELAEFWRKEIIDRGLGLFTMIVKRGIARGEFREVAPGHAARLCVAPLLVLILWRTLFARFDAEPYDYPGLIEAHVTTLPQGLAA